MQQLDIFEDSRDVMLRNDLLHALSRRDAKAARSAWRLFADEYPRDPALAQLAVLVAAIEAPRPTPFAAGIDLHAARKGLVMDIEPAARRAFGAAAGHSWAKPLWADLARAAARLTFGTAAPQDHAAPLWLHAGDAAAARQAVEAIESWRRIPAPLAWMTEACYRVDGLDAAWPLLTELAWLSPPRFAELTERVADPLLNSLRQRFDAGFDASLDDGVARPASAANDDSDGDGDGDPAGNASADLDLQWFPAWLLTEKPALASRLELAQPGLHSAAEKGLRLVLELLRLEHQGRHHDLIERRRTLRGLSPALFAAYMKSR
jgi:hypothetical protein